MLDLFENFGIGTDIEKISRFEGKSLENDKNFFNKIFTENEIKYAFSKNKPSQHLAVRYCAKEAVVKALSSLSDITLSYSEIEILNKANGNPYVNLLKYNDKFSIKLSLSHCEDTAMAFVVIKKF